MDYKTSGVDIEAGYKSVELMKEHVKKTMRPEVLGGLGGFSGAFSLSKIKEMEGDPDKNLEKYSRTGSPEYCRLVEAIRAEFGMTSLKFNTLETLVEAIGLPKCSICTHCFDGSSTF